MITSAMLARQIILPQLFRTKLTPLLRYSCSLLPLFLRVASFVFNSLQPLLPKTGGWGGLAQVISDLARRTHRFFSPLFSWSYKSLFSQPLCFHIHLRCPPGVPLAEQIPKSGNSSTLLHGSAQRYLYILRIFRAVQTFQLSTVDCQPPFPSARMLVTP